MKLDFIKHSAACTYIVMAKEEISGSSLRHAHQPVAANNNSPQGGRKMKRPLACIDAGTHVACNACKIPSEFCSTHAYAPQARALVINHLHGGKDGLAG